MAMTPQEAIKLLNQIKRECDWKVEKAYDSYCIYPNPDDQRDCNEYGNRAKAVEMAAEALASKIPRKIEMKEDKFGLSYHLYCPACETYFGGKGKRGIWLGKKPAYCCNCGQRLDWSDIDDNIPT